MSEKVGRENVVKISSNGIVGNININGNDIRGVSEYSIKHCAGEVPKINLSLFVGNIKIDVDSCELLIDDVVMEESLEKALFVYLNKKYMIP